MRELDNKVDKLISKWVDDKFYSQLENAKVERVINREEQIQGIDLKITSNNKTILIDEKAATRYINRNLSTFSFELSFINRAGYENEGWLLNSKLKTEYYTLMYINAKTSDLEQLTYDDINEIECVMVKKEDIIKYLELNKITKSNLSEVAKKVREQNIERLNITNDLTIRYSSQLKEKSINVLISKNILKKLATKIFTIYQ